MIMVMIYNYSDLLNIPALYHCSESGIHTAATHILRHLKHTLGHHLHALLAHLIKKQNLE